MHNKYRKNPKVLTEGHTPSIAPDGVKPTKLRNKLKVGAILTEQDQLDVLRVLFENNDRFAYTIEELSRYTGPAMEINLNSQKYIFRPQHKLGEKELAYAKVTS